MFRNVSTRYIYIYIYIGKRDYEIVCCMYVHSYLHLDTERKLYLSACQNHILLSFSSSLARSFYIMMRLSLYCCFAGLYPNAARVVMPQSTYMKLTHGTVARPTPLSKIKLFLSDHTRAFVHPGSLLFHESRFENMTAIYNEKVVG